MADAMMKYLGEANGVKWYWAEPGRFEKPGVYYWDGASNVLCVPYPAQQAGQGEPRISTEHGPWLPSTYKEEEGETYCQRCLLRSKFIGQRKCEPHIVYTDTPPATGQVERKSDDIDRLLREVFALCEATEDAPEVEPRNEHQRGFDKGRRFEAKQIRRAIGEWLQSEFCGRAFMGEPAITAPPAPQQPEALAQQERDREDAERWRAFIGLDYKVRMEWACNLSMVPVLIEWVDQLRAARSSEGGDK